MSTQSIYIHFPWCIKKCPYCDFNSHKASDALPEFEYVQALLADLDDDLSMFEAGVIKTIFMGGGTPSLFSPEALAVLFQGLKSRLQFDDDIEITMEANPGTFEQERFFKYRSLGINRLSIGIQSFNATHLKSLGRVHNDLEAKNAISMARKAGFDNINLDIMHGLPSQSIDEGLADLKVAIDLSPSHISWYQLTIEPNTVFYRKPPVLPHDDALAELEERGFSMLKEAGFLRYEISAFSKPNRMAKHNLAYWHYDNYFGIGAGAHGKHRQNQNTLRTRKVRQPASYLKSSVEQRRLIEPVLTLDVLFEYMLNTTRLEGEIPYDLFSRQTYLDDAMQQNALKKAHASGFVELSDKGWRVSELGRRFTNDLQALFLP